MTTFLSRYPLVRVQLHLSNRRVDLINERYDVAFRIQSDFETDQSLTLCNLGSSHLVLVAEPSLLAGRIIRTPEDLAPLPTLSMGEHMDRDRWDLVNAVGEVRSYVQAPRLCCEDLGMLRAAALAGLGVALLPEDSCVEDVRRGALVHVLPQWSSQRALSTWFSRRPGACCRPFELSSIISPKPFPSCAGAGGCLFLTRARSRLRRPLQMPLPVEGLAERSGTKTRVVEAME
jgi:DNA-binding transcriptional LysR family regulator